MFHQKDNHLKMTLPEIQNCKLKKYGLSEFNESLPKHCCLNVMSVERRN